MGRYSWAAMRPDRSIVTPALVLCCAALSLQSAARAQTGRAFTAEDMLKVSTASVLDLSDDGRRAAVSVRRAYDNAEVDNRRYGDPTYCRRPGSRCRSSTPQTGRHSVTLHRACRVGRRRGRMTAGASRS